MMKTIEIPYLPINSFEASSICKKFEETDSEKNEDSDDTKSRSLSFPEENGLASDVSLVLHGMGMEKYANLFKKEQVSLDTFLELNDSDLLELGITDPNDRETIVKNLEIHQTHLQDFVVAENHLEDLRIAKNLFNQLLLIQNYCAYIELHMKMNKLTDYRISWKDSACSYLKTFIKAAITQNKIMTRLLYSEYGSDHLIGKHLKMYKLTVPENLQGKLKFRKRNMKTTALKVMIVAGFCSMIMFTGKFLLGRE